MYDPRFQTPCAELLYMKRNNITREIEKEIFFFYNDVQKVHRSSHAYY